MTRPAAAATIGWGFFLSASWTWCIGMFLPFVLMWQYGSVGFLAFAIPNVVGCAAFGYILRRDDARALRERLGGWTKGFSWATIAFQAWFAGWMLPWEIGLAVVIGALLLARRWGSREWILASLVAAAVTAGCIFDGGRTALASLPMQGSLPEADLYFLAPVIALGFLACPYLDLTFHRALEESPSRHAFGIFGLLFAATLAGIATLWDPAPISAAIPWALTILWAVQLMFTIGVHAREGLTPLEGARRSSRGAILFLALAALATGWVVHSEAVYLRWLGFYGLLFPFFLVFRLRSVPTLWGWGAIAASLPCYELGFIRHETVWLSLPLALLVVLLMAPLDKGPRKEPLRA